MRDILFRGKRRDNGEWVYGNYILQNDNDSKRANYLIPYIKPRNCVNMYPVDPDTVGQFTGLTDRNGKRIFEGDIFKADNGSQSCIAVVKFGEYFPKMFYDMLCMLNHGVRKIPAKGFYAETVDKHEEMILFQSPCVEVIGNIHDNPELLEVGEC